MKVTTCDPTITMPLVEVTSNFKQWNGAPGRDTGSNFLPRKETYTELPEETFTFNDAMLISGHYTRDAQPSPNYTGDMHISQHFGTGIIEEDRFYYRYFTKNMDRFKRMSTEFWDPWGRKSRGQDKWVNQDGAPGDTFNLKIEDKKPVVFNEPVYFWININLYFHFLTEFIPLFKMMRQNPGYPIISQKMHKWQWDYINLFPDIAERIIELEHPFVVKAPVIKACPLPTTNGNYFVARRHPEIHIVSHWVKDFLKESFKPKNESPHKKIYITRKDSNINRFVANEDRIIEFFEKKGFKTFVFSKMSAQEKIDVCHSMETMAVPFGSGSTHTCSSTPESKVLSFGPPYKGSHDNHYRNCSQSDWYRLFTATGNSTRDFPVDLNDVEAAYNRLGV